MKKITSGTDARNLWNIKGSFGEIKGAVTADHTGYAIETDACHVQTAVVQDENGVCTHTTTIRNVTDSPLTLTCARQKFIFNGGEYDIYTQYNGWENESQGGWQPLITTVAAEVAGVRSTNSAAPILVLWNRQTGRGTAFHLLAQGAWIMKAARVTTGGATSVVEVEVGLSDNNFSYPLVDGEELTLPEIICYNVRNRTDLDCWKLHANINRRYPRKALPVIYNTWLCRFDMINYDNLANQIAPAAEMGADYFVIDAGWFGKGGDWAGCRGDWRENMTGALCGRMGELADAVRAAGMQFGLWLEIESASAGSDIVRDHPEYFIVYRNQYLLDFSNPQVCDYILNTICGLIEKYGIRFIKFDFNQDMKLDENQSSFLTYFEGYNSVIRGLRQRHPEVYLENCASGGQRMSLGNLPDFDSFWLSDNQGPCEGIRIFKDTLLRMPPCAIEKWATITSLTGFEPVYGTGGTTEKILATDDAIWTRVVSVDGSFLRGFLTGGAMGFSCDLNRLSPETRAMLRDFIAAHKAKEEFWKKAVCRILTDTPTMLVLEFSDTAFEHIELLVFSWKNRQSAITVCPVLDTDANYRMGEQLLAGSDIDADGIDVRVPGDYRMVQLVLDKE
ncbi:MAG: alpha-galactosidase [Clostridia bacterium]|nr:alpha-galactosidase [Clostridia bacterium]